MLPWFLPLASDDRVLAVTRARGQIDLRKIEDSLKRGASAAESLPCVRVTDLVHSLGLKIRVDPGGFDHAGVVRHAQYEASSRTITVFRRSVEELREGLRLADPKSPFESRIDDLLVLHEVYHHLERSSRSRRTPRHDETAAHAFAKAALGFPFLPIGLDWLRLVAQGRCTPDGLKRSLETAANLLAVR